jgi:DNA-binding beta-propeller fold protein YncE
LDGAGHLVVVDSGNHRVQVLNYADGSHVRSIGSQGSGDGQFTHPYGVTVSSDGNIVVYDAYNCRIQFFQLSDGAH